jgi:methionine-rich copper-binding protein CopC
MKPSISWLAIAPLVFATPAFSLPAKTDLTYSFPGAGTIEREPVPFVQLGFGGAVDMVAVEIVNPDDTQTELYNAATDLVPMKTNAMFGITLPTSLDAPGDYRINYTIAVPGKDTTAETKSGSFSFTIDLPEQPTGDAPEQD